MQSLNEELQRKLEENRFLLIQGVTGCGKSTQVPPAVMSLNENEVNNDSRPVLVTVPRRIPTIRLWRYLNFLMGSTNRTMVGYQMRKDSQLHSGNRIILQTTGYFFAKVMHEPSYVDKFSTIIIDEVHERQKETDLLLGVLKQLFGFVKNNEDNENSQKQTEKDKGKPALILMSATMKGKKFLDYFGFNTPADEEEAVWSKKFTITITHGMTFNTAFDIQDFYLEDIVTNQKQLQEYSSQFKKEEPKVHKFVYKLILEQIVKLVDSKKEILTGEILVFLPGAAEIAKFVRVYNQHFKDRISLQLQPLYSKMSQENWEDFEKDECEKDHLRVILATSIAESSVTFEKLKVVFNFGLTKQEVVDEETGLEKLVLRWSSQEQTIQRRGRVGRKSDGKVFNMFPKWIFDLDLQQTPQIQLTGLESTVLMLKKFETKVKTPMPANFVPTFLRSLLDPPSDKQIDTAFINLLSNGALAAVQNKDKVDTLLTRAGKIMTEIQYDIRLCRTILLCHSLGFLEDGLIIAAEFSKKNESLFKVPSPSLTDWFAKLHASKRAYSDDIATICAYRAWECIHREVNPVPVKNIDIDLTCTRDSLLPKMKLWIQELKNQLKTHFSDLRSGRKLDQLSKLEKERIKSDDSFLLQLAIGGALKSSSFFVTVPVGFKSYCNNSNYKHDLFNSIFLDNTTIAFNFNEHVQHIRREMGQPQGHMPIALYDQQEGTITVTFSTQEPNPFMGNFHEGVLGALQRKKVIGYDKFEWTVLKELQHPIQKLDKRAASFYKVQDFLNPNNFSVIANTDEELYTQIQQLFEKKCKLLVKMTLVDAKLNARCIVLDSSIMQPNMQTYQRGEIKIVARESDCEARRQRRQEYLVYCTDVGKTCWYSLDNLYIFPVKSSLLLKTPPLAINCSIAAIIPFNSFDWDMQVKLSCSELFKRKWKNQLVLHIAHQDSRGVQILSDVSGFRMYQTSLVRHLVTQKLAAPCSIPPEPVKEIIFPETYELVGPYSPLQMQLKSCQSTTKSYDVEVDMCSVNSILLESSCSTSSQYNRKVIVAGSIRVGGKKSTSEKDHVKPQIVLDRTTLLPPIPGTYELMALTFFPFVQVVKDANGDCGILNVFNKHADGSLTQTNTEVFSIQLDKEDIVLIQETRSFINSLYMDQSTRETEKNNKGKLNTNLLKLFRKNRPLFDPQPCLTQFLPMKCEMNCFMQNIDFV